MSSPYYNTLRLWKSAQRSLLLQQTTRRKVVHLSSTFSTSSSSGNNNNSSSTAALSVLTPQRPFVSTTTTTHSSSSNNNNNNNNNNISSFLSLSTLSDWFLKEPERGTGFDNFLKRNEKNNDPQQQQQQQHNNTNNKDDSDKKKNRKKSSGSSSGSGGGGGGGRGGSGNNNTENNNGLFIMATMIAATIYILSQSDSAKDESTSTSSTMHGGGAGGGGGGGTLQPNQQNHSYMDLTWSEFLQLLERDDVFKIVIHQNASRSRDGSGGSGDDHHAPATRARVYLKPGAHLDFTGSLHDTSTTTSTSSGSSSSSSSDHRHPNNTAEEDRTEWNGGEVLEMGNRNTNSTSGRNQGFLSSSSSSSSTNTTPTAANTTPLVYRNLRIGSAASLERKLEEAQRALGRPKQNDVPVQYQVDSGVTNELLSLLPWVLLSAFLISSFRGAASRMGGVGAAGSQGGGGGGPGGGMFGMGKSTAQKFTKEMNINIGFKDVAGVTEAKREIMEFVEFLQTPDRFTQLGAKIPKGALLTGPPGTGKTLLAKAVAGEAGVPFYSLAGSEFLEMFVGVGPSRVRDLFREARENAPCIIFIDEIDSIGRKRGKSSAMGGNDERENTLNQLLVEMDGFDPSAGVICLAGTNRDDVLDPALTRPGRFDRKIQVDLPDIEGRKEIFQVHLEKITLVEDLGPARPPLIDGADGHDDDDEEEYIISAEHKSAIDNVASRLAGLTPGFSGADIANICNEAAIVAARRNANFVTMEDFEQATDRVIGGLESNRIMSPQEKKVVAYHEAGHAVAGWFLEHADPLLKVTIIPRASGALGFAQYLPKEVHLKTQDAIMDTVSMALAGRASEEVFFGSVTTGASDDLRRVTQMVYSTIQLYGMNNRLGQLAFPKDPNAMWEERQYSEKTAKAMDEEAKRIVDEAYQQTVALIKERREEVDKVAKLLLEKETINHDEVYDLIGERPFKGDANYNEFVSRRSSERGSEEEVPEADGPVSDDLGGPDLKPSF